LRHDSNQCIVERNQMFIRFVKYLGLTLRLLSLSVALFAGTAAAQDNAAPVDSAAIFNKCLSGSLSDDGRIQDDFIALPIRTLFVDGETRSIAEVLCIVSASSEEPKEFDWFRIDRATRQLTKVYTGIWVGRVLPSPNGKYLAVYQSQEGAQSIDIVDLPRLMRNNTYKIIDVIGGFPGSVSIEEWKGRELHITSDQFLSAGGGDLLSPREETFILNVETGTIVAQSPSLQDPVRYYCDKLAKMQGERRNGNPDYDWESILALGRLGKQSGVACLESALRAETNEEIRAEIRTALEDIARAAALGNDCLSGNRTDPNTKGILLELIASDKLLCIANATDERHGSTWFLLDPTKPDTGGVLRGAGTGGDKVERLLVSPDGKYLAVEHGFVDVVDLPVLLKSGRYRSVQLLVGSIKEWNGASLEVTSDTLLSRAPVEIDGESHALPLLAKESFLWDSKTENVTPVWSALQHPNRYYCEGLSSPEIEKRRIAARGLRLLRDKDTASCIEQALRSELDESLQRELREVLVTLTKP
jgi:hypothetical protein